MIIRFKSDMISGLSSIDYNARRISVNLGAHCYRRLFLDHSGTVCYFQNCFGIVCYSRRYASMSFSRELWHCMSNKKIVILGVFLHWPSCQSFPTFLFFFTHGALLSYFIVWGALVWYVNPGIAPRCYSWVISGNVWHFWSTLLSYFIILGALVSYVNQSGIPVYYPWDRLSTVSHVGRSVIAFYCLGSPVSYVNRGSIPVYYPWDRIPICYSSDHSCTICLT